MDLMWHDDGPSLAARAYAAFDAEWVSPAAMLATPDNMIFPFDDMPEPVQPDWDEFTHLDQYADEDEGHFCLSEPSFSGSPSSWDIAALTVEPPLTPDSPPYSSFGAPLSPHTPLGSFEPRTRSSGRVPTRRHAHNALSSPLRTPALPRPPHMRTMSHSSALGRPNLLMSPRTLRNSTLDAALAQPDSQLHFHHVTATPYSTSAPSRPAPIPAKHRSPTPADDHAPSAGEDDPRKPSPDRPADLGPPTRSRLHPPKQAPSTWQIFFTEYLQNFKASNPERKLNVSQAAKDGGAAYKALTPDQREARRSPFHMLIYARKARIAKEEYDREFAAWQRTLTPEDVRVENAYRAAQRRAGKSRRSNLKDPNAPKKPLSAYFMFLQWIRADPARVRDVFGDESETTRQSVLAATRWRDLSDDEKRPFLAQAEREKLEYEAARKDYEERTTGISNPNLYTGGYMRMNAGTSTSNTWQSADADPAESQGNPRGRRSSSFSPTKLAGGAAFGALVFGPVFDDDAVGDGDVDEGYGSISWKHT